MQHADPKSGVSTTLAPLRNPAFRAIWTVSQRLGWRGPFLDSLEMASFPAHRGRDAISNCAGVINGFISPCLPET